MGAVPEIIRPFTNLTSLFLAGTEAATFDPKYPARSCDIQRHLLTTNDAVHATAATRSFSPLDAA